MNNGKNTKNNFKGKSNPNYKHGMKGTRIYRIWQRIKARCLNKNTNDYKYYGGRGIKVCKRWLNSFENFYEDLSVGYEDDLTIDRIDNNGDYEPLNCRWVSRKIQSQNKRNNIFITYGSETKSLKKWAQDLGLKYKTLHCRIFEYNMPLATALTSNLYIRPKLDRVLKQNRKHRSL